MPFYPRGCYVSITDRGNVKAVLEEYAAEMLPKAKPGADGTERSLELTTSGSLLPCPACPIPLTQR